VIVLASSATTFPFLFLSTCSLNFYAKLLRHVFLSFLLGDGCSLSSGLKHLFRRPFFSSFLRSGYLASLWRSRKDFFFPDY